MELESLTIDGAHGQRLLQVSTTATALAELHYERIEAQDIEINSFLALSRERALLQAAKIDALVAKGDVLPPLAGVPVGIKDVLAMQGAPATAGSLILKAVQYRRADQILVVEQGQIVERGTHESLYQLPRPLLRPLHPPARPGSQPLPGPRRRRQDRRSRDHQSLINVHVRTF